MNGWTKEVTLNIIQSKVTSIRSSYEEFMKVADGIEKESLEFLEGLLEQIPNAISGPLIPKTPKVPKKRELKRIKTIPEDDVVSNGSKTSETMAEDSRMSEQIYDVPPTRMRRAASQKAAQSIKDQQALGIGSKLRRPSSIEDSTLSQSKLHSSRAKRAKSAMDTSDEEDNQRPTKLSKTKLKSQGNSEGTKELDTIKLEPDRTTNQESPNEEDISTRKKSVRNKRQREKSEETLSRQNSRGSGKMWKEPAAKKANIEESYAPETDVTMEASLYEDAIGKSIPMNSTMNPNTTVTIDRKIMDVTVVLDHMKMPRQMNETVTLKKATNLRSSNHADKTLVNEEQSVVEKTMPPSPRAPAVLQSKNNLHDKMKILKETLANPEFDALITEDESSPEREGTRNKKAINKQPKNKVPAKQTKRFTRSSLLTEDDDVLEVAATPPRPKTALRDPNGLKPSKNSYKPNALFSPYSKESVKKRVEAFEQAGLNSPKTVEIDAPARLTRTKTRALAAAASETQSTQIGLTVAQKAARKSLSRAKEIAKMKERKENEESKENNILNSAQKTSRLLLAMNEKFALKQQQRTTPIGKSRLQMPMSVSRIPRTPSDPHIIIQNKALTATKSNIITSVDSFIQPPKTLTKSNSNDNLTDKRRRVNDEDAKRKREEALKAMSEEKRRKREEKELKNKLAREAKEKLEMEKRLKQEREREEKAKAALILHEKQREELERKRLIQLQRAQEKEERRRQEEQLRLLRLQEQEEAERQLAEQKRREQEAEKRKIAELRSQQATAAEAARLKAQYIAKTKQTQQQDPTSYMLDSDNPDDESDDESRPKHVIPYWAQEGVRATQLAIQQYIPAKTVLAFFGAKSCTPDLTQLFKGIKKERLQRTSSAIWKTPPRYSMMMNNE